MVRPRAKRLYSPAFPQALLNLGPARAPGGASCQARVLPVSFANDVYSTTYNADEEVVLRESAVYQGGQGDRINRLTQFSIPCTLKRSEGLRSRFLEGSLRAGLIKG